MPAVSTLTFTNKIVIVHVFDGRLAITVGDWVCFAFFGVLYGWTVRLLQGT